MDRICSEFTEIEKQALHQPETSEELMNIMSFIEKARTTGMIKLNERIKVRILEISINFFCSHKENHSHASQS